EVVPVLDETRRLRARARSMDGYSGDRDENDLIRARAHAPTELRRASRDGIARRDEQHAHASARDDVTPARRGRENARVIVKHRAAIRREPPIDEDRDARPDEPPAPFVPCEHAVSSWYRTEGRDRIRTHLGRRGRRE